MATDATALRASPIFADLSEQEAASIAASCTLRRYDPGMRLFDEGDAGKSLLVVTSGMATLTRLTPAGHTMQIGRCRTGEVLGEMALIDAAPRSATATALTPLTALEMKRATFEQLLSAASPAASKILHQLSLLLSTRLRAVIERIEEELMLEAEEEAILSHEQTFHHDRTIRTSRPPPMPERAMPSTLQGHVAAAPDDDSRHGELWRVLWGVTR